VTASRLPPVRVRAALLVVLAAALALVVAAPAHAVPRKVPAGWLGVVADGPLLAPGFPLEPEFDRMVADGVESVRTAFYWSDAQPYPNWGSVPAEQQSRFVDAEGMPTDFSELDRVVTAAAARRLTLLPVVIRSPRWAALQPDNPASPPTSAAAYARFATALVHRYGPNGSFWGQHPELRPMPLRSWQIWNEPNITRYWSKQPFAGGYVRLLRAARKAIKTADPGAHVVLCGLANFSWIALRAIYRAGGRGLFDIGAVHPFTSTPRLAVKIVRYNRAVMRKNGDGRKPLYITELTWSSAKGKTRNTFGWETTERGQASRLTEAYRRLVAARRSLGIARAYWYTWLTPDASSPNSFDWSGLRKLSGGGIVDKPALRAYRAVARRIEGCAKAAVATSCA
jgi:hypothetical protein